MSNSGMRNRIIAAIAADENAREVMIALLARQLEQAHQPKDSRFAPVGAKSENRPQQEET